MALLFIAVGCARGSDGPARSGTSEVETSSDGDEAQPLGDASPVVADRCIDESLAEFDIDPVGSIDYAASDVEQLLPPPLRTSGPVSDDTAILLGAADVGEVAVERVAENQYRAVAFRYCVPSDLSLERIDLVETLGGTWTLIDVTPELELPRGAAITLTIDDESPVGSDAYVTGDAICNGYQAIPAAGPDGAFRFTRVLFTEAECIDEEVIYRDMLMTTDTWALSGRELLLSGPMGDLRYAPLDR